MTDLIHTVNMIRNVPHSELRSAVKRVVVILSSPRSGSSLVKNVLASHPDVASLDGEIEPYLVLTRNGFGHNSDCDAIHALSNENDLVDNIFDDLSVPSVEWMPLEQLKEQWKNRILLQFPSLFSKELELVNLNKIVSEILDKAMASKIFDEREWQSIILSNIYKKEPWRVSYYDGRFDCGMKGYFDETQKIEEPPFVVPRHNRRKFTKNDVENKILLFKTPPDAYRIGMYEKLFPNADVKYIHLTRGYAQSVNGLIDGWLSPVGFFSHDMKKAELDLNIKGYSDVVEFGKRWWKFELPPNWREFTVSSLEDVCLNQWISTHQAIIASGVKTLQVHFEEFLSTPISVANKIVNYIGLPEMKFQQPFHFTMITETPKLMRWKKREAQLLELGKRSEVKDMMELLEYEMNPETWA